MSPGARLSCFEQCSASSPVYYPTLPYFGTSLFQYRFWNPSSTFLLSNLEFCPIKREGKEEPFVSAR
jgi:hypothetical protein